MHHRNGRASRWAPPLVVTALSLAVATSAAARDDFPEVSHDGLHLRKGTELAAVYVKPGADFGVYDKVMILDCFVSFKKHWRSEDAVRAMQVHTSDMTRIKKRLADEFEKVFTQELEKNDGYPVVTQPGTDVLLLRPAIIDLDVEAPDVMSAGSEMTFAASAGEMTLYLELYDSHTSDILARVIDPEAGRNNGMIGWQSGPANIEQADQILGKWAEILRKRLEEARARDEK